LAESAPFGSNNQQENVMPILQAMDGKFYDLPDDKAAAFEVPREKVKELLESAGALAPQAGPGPGAGPGGGGPGGPGGGMPAGSPIVFQIFTQGGGSALPSGGYAPPGGGGQQGENADVNPYWWWRNAHWGPYWRNTWSNW
jgi:hypothetical protein